MIPSRIFQGGTGYPTPCIPESACGFTILCSLAKLPFTVIAEMIEPSIRIVFAENSIQYRSIITLLSYLEVNTALTICNQCMIRCRDAIQVLVLRMVGSVRIENRLILVDLSNMAVWGLRHTSNGGTQLLCFAGFGDSVPP